MSSPSGQQFELTGGGYSAVITEVGATLRELRQGDRALVAGYGADELRPASRGAVLAPWPNRIADGRYSFDGQTYQLPLTEPARGNALHGLVSWTRWEAVEHDTDRVTLRHALVPQPGYPHPLELTVRYLLDDDGLRWSVEAVNTGNRPAPYGCAPHPYLVAGAGTVDDWTLQLPAGQFLDVTTDRLLPVGLHSVAATTLDFHEPQAIGAMAIDRAFTSIDADVDGMARAQVTAADGQGVAMTWDPATCPWVQVFTADRPGDPGHRAGLAVEPMTCPPDAFNSGTDLVVLAPGASHRAEWHLSAF